MKRPTDPLILLSLPCLVLMAAGCQRSMNGSMATGPFAPAGSSSSASGSQLFPVGPITGATRVPPPATGSSSAANAYGGAPSASNFTTPTAFQASAGSPLNSGTSATSASPSSAAPGNSFRNSLGGMQVIDLTAQLPPENAIASAPHNATYAGAAATSVAPGYRQLGPDQLANATVIGSGVYAAPFATETSVRTPQPADLLRPIDPPYAAVPVPRYRGIEPTATTSGSYAAAPVSYASGTNVRPAGGFGSTDAWQSVASQPVPAASYNSGAMVGVNRSGPSTDPVPPVTSAPAAQVASPSLPWRSPTTAR